MAIRQLSLNDFRNLHSTTLDFDPHFNIILGQNGAGKTSLLEAIYIICQGQSFKTRSLEQCIQHDKESFLIFARFDHYKAGISRDHNQTKIRLNNENISRLSELAEKTPVRIINADTFSLVDGPPSIKREYIDWCVFHVEHDYHTLWLEYRHALKQRNALLKTRQQKKQLVFWDEHLNLKNDLIYKQRKKYVAKIDGVIKNQLNSLVEDLEISIEYRPGWDTKQSLFQQLKKQQDKDFRHGFTHYGIHRDDIKIFTRKLPIEQELSRGQLKRLSIGLILAQILLLKKYTDKPIILLIDDINAELDTTSLQVILQLLSDQGLQLFVTSIEGLDASLQKTKEYKMFHVEHGMIRPVKSS